VKQGIDCLEVALSKKGSLQDPARLRSWLFSILNNLFLMRLRRIFRNARSANSGRRGD
jgi:DNA-directed RNA polymerase specialized sigma24 family protein